jgi:hypothetical protein
MKAYGGTKVPEKGSKTSGFNMGGEVRMALIFNFRYREV